ncbi:Sec-independent protein translocase protein TatB [Rhodoferax sp.]|uniref:Sec-independent protein translocase protein TatB n=1 Tax=Rhodoferax sp. TaxID=50421 RepID=UPI0025F3C77A|nr:Sec-independent protein translocase protein TatB [Rhodoferax sp.]MCM2339689.1 Sec-independent protein translocase protein TatB [Rhodoferax sp.]
MIDLGISKLAMIGAVALIVIGPEKLPRVARTVGTLIGKAQRYVTDVKAEVSRSMALDELKQMKDSVESAVKDVSQSVQTSADDFEKTWAEATHVASEPASDYHLSLPEVIPEYRHPKKNWRLKQGATPNWFKARTGVRTKALSGAARVARFRPTKFN